MSQSKRYWLRCVNISVAISTELILNASQRDELAAISQSRSLLAGYVFRAKLILMLAEGASFRTIEHKLGTTAPTIVRWKERFLSGGIDGLNTYHPGQRPNVLTPALRARILAATGKSQPMDRRTGVAANSRPIWASAKMWCTGCVKKRV